ncbi:MAG: class I SAM-dependent methyltransferase [Candidatus Competibacter sp.]|nr:class I SAM-dependent methyltransferase [Candidatus Competibacter sp.]MDG4583735.1 class I SAM-dependent methyltransferase [Candidatus Competibacter sp.]
MSRYYAADRQDLVDFLRPHGHFGVVLDIGCAGGCLGRQLLMTGLAERCDGIEPNEEAATQAADRLHRIWVADLAAVAEQVPWPDYDLLIMADVLEHLIDPWQVLAELHRRARPGARLLLSVPNVRHKSVVLPLLFRGRFDYADAGILDRTHLHFFTRSSLLDAVGRAGWRVATIAPFIKPKYRRWWFPHRMLGEFLAVQYFLLVEK